MASDITNCYQSDAPLPRLAVERTWLYQPAAEWSYSHHPHLTVFDGRLYAIWSNGRRDEDAPGQRVLLATAEDVSSWSAPRALLGPLLGEHSEVVLTAAGFHQHAGQLIVYLGRYEYQAAVMADARRPEGDRGHQDTGLWAMTTTDGEAWSAPRALGVPIVPNHGAQATASGRLIISGNVMFPYTDDPAGLAGWTATGIYPPGEPVVDDSEGFWRIQERQGWPVGLCEGSFFQTDDGILHMLLRSNTDRLWVTESADDGASWSAPQITGFTDNATKFHFGRLPDGRFYYVGCPDPDPLWTRSRLVLSLSEDGIRFDRHFVIADEPYEQRQPGLHKGGDYGYPHTLAHDGHLYVIVSRRKEAVEVIRIRMEALA